MQKLLIILVALFALSVSAADKLSKEVLALQGVWAPVDEEFEEGGISCRLVVHGTYFLFICSGPTEQLEITELRHFTADGEWITNDKGEKWLEYGMLGDSKVSIANTRKSEVELKRVGTFPNIDTPKKH